jgi:phosphatidylglycerophosphatase A
MNKVLDYLAVGVATTGFTGFLGKDGKGGGTIGSIVAFIVLWTFIVWGVSLLWVFTAAVLSFWLGLLVVDLAADYIYSSQGPRRKHDGSETSFDFNQINWDEFHGMFVASLPVFLMGPLFGMNEHQMVYELFWSLVFFRIFDVWKPWLVKKTEKLYGALGVMLDDTVAGAFAALLVALDIITKNLHTYLP